MIPRLIFRFHALIHNWVNSSLPQRMCKKPWSMSRIMLIFMDNWELFIFDRAIMRARLTRWHVQSTDVQEKPPAWAVGWNVAFLIWVKNLSMFRGWLSLQIRSSITIPMDRYWRLSVARLIINVSKR